jgi:NAD+ synthase (glutamine-hydrolysing)
MKIAWGQINTTVGDFAGNVATIESAYRRAAAAGAELVVFPELAVTGYPPRDLLLRPGFVGASEAALQRLAAGTGAAAMLVGYVGARPAGPGRRVTNGAALCQHGEIVAVRAKSLLPTYDVFDEDRYFEPAEENRPIEWAGIRLGVTICEDIWNDEDFWPERRYRRNPAADLVAGGVDLLVNLSASPWHLGKNRTRREMLRGLAVKAGVPVVYCNLVGGNDELVFDGGSLAFDRTGALLGCGPLFEEQTGWVDLRAGAGVKPDEPADVALVHDALVLGLRDYLHKCGFRTAVLGLSGGVDSAVTACLAVSALGRDRVHGVLLPSEYSSQGSLDDARDLAVRLGIRHDVISIQEPFVSVKAQLRGVFAGRAEDVTEENLQARLRGAVLMAISNKEGSMLLTTGNKSELAVGYCTLYGDMCGGLAVISDVPKTMVYRIARWINREREMIPESTIRKAPSAELRPNQTDQDSLPPYDVLDAILEAHVVEGRPAEEILRMGFEPEVVVQVLRLIDASEHKRRQAAPGLKVTTKAFGVGRRVPIAQWFRAFSSPLERAPE